MTTTQHLPVADRAGSMAADLRADHAWIRQDSTDEPFLDKICQLVDDIEQDAFRACGLSLHDFNAVERHAVRSAAWEGLGHPL